MRSHPTGGPPDRRVNAPPPRRCPPSGLIGVGHWSPRLGADLPTLRRAAAGGAPSAVTQAAVLYVFRTMVADDIPLNDGCLKPIDLVIPAGSLLARAGREPRQLFGWWGGQPSPSCVALRLSPTYPAAVVAGNVETSQAVCDASGWMGNNTRQAEEQTFFSKMTTLLQGYPSAMPS